MQRWPATVAPLDRRRGVGVYRRLAVRVAGDVGEINGWDDGRGVYFDDLNGHLLEIIPRPYGSGGTAVSRPHPLVASVVTPVSHEDWR